MKQEFIVTLISRDGVELYSNPERGWFFEEDRYRRVFDVKAVNAAEAVLWAANHVQAKVGDWFECEGVQYEIAPIAVYEGYEYE